MPPAKVAIVTGANRGIGLAIVRQLALQYADPPRSDQGPLLIYLTARDESRGEAALESIYNDANLAKAKVLATHGGAVTIAYRALDISDSQSIRALAEYIKAQHPEGIDIVVNNAGIALSGFDAEVVNQTIRCNYYGTLEATQAFLPHIRSGGRLVNVASRSGHLDKYAEAIRQQFLATRTVGQVTTLMEQFKSAVAAGDEKSKGWPGVAYAVSKAGVIGMTRAVAWEHRGKGGKVVINSCCPGFVNTDMTGGRGVKTPDEGAQTPVMLALDDIGEKVGLFWRNEKPIEW